MFKRRYIVPNNTTQSISRYTNPIVIIITNSKLNGQLNIIRYKPTILTNKRIGQILKNTGSSFLAKIGIEPACVFKSIVRIADSCGNIKPIQTDALSSCLHQRASKTVSHRLSHQQIDCLQCRLRMFL